MRLSRSVVVLAVLACPWLATAADAPHSPSYLPPDAVDGTTLLPGPPPPGSPFALAEQETMRNVQEIRGPALVALAKRYDNISVFSLLRPVLGEWCNPETLPRTADLFERVHQDVEPCIERTKANWRRDRPYVADLTLQPIVYRPSNTSYPSGHSVLAEMFAVLLSEAIPAHAPDWKRQSGQVRWSRVVGGAHYPSDTVAGGLLGAALGQKLLASAELQAGLVAVRTEIEAATAEHAKPGNKIETVPVAR